MTTSADDGREPATPSGWGPAGRRAAVSITFDNLGEAMELSLGTWPAGAPIGRHHSVLEVLPRVLELLEHHGVRCTYFVEGWSAGVYPRAVRALREAGHEVGCHGWRHEHWSALEGRAMEAELIARAVAALRAQGVDPRGFRPPGGGMTASTPELLRGAGFSYVSPPGRRALAIDGLVALPFRWTGVDAYYFFDAFGELRIRCGDTEDVLPPECLVTRVDRILDDVVATGGYVSLLFHPFLLADEDRFAAMAEIVASVVRRHDIWCASCREHAEWALRHPEVLDREGELDRLSWR
jgi:peptidoglycan/xylan/chitin deacetylase (PgdA/CDA1 family)